MPKKLGFATVALALALLAAAAARSIPNTSSDLGYDGRQVHASRTFAAGNNLTEDDDFSRIFGATGSNANANADANGIVKRHPGNSKSIRLAPVATVKLFRNKIKTHWVGQIEVGTPRRGGRRQMPTVIVDTGSSVLWVTSSTVRSSTSSNKYDPGQSRTSDDLKKHFKTSYVSGSLEGWTYSDVVNVGGLKLDMSFGRVTEPHSFPIDSSDGVLGLSLSPVPQYLDTHFMSDVRGKYPDLDPVAAFYFGTEPELHLGQVKKVYLGEKIEYHPVVPVNDTFIFWAIGDGEIVVGEKTVVVPGIRTVFDTGAGPIMGPLKEVEKFYRAIPGHYAYPERNGQVFYGLPCRLMPRVSFRWRNGKLWTIDPEVLVSRIIGKAGWCKGELVGAKLPFKGQDAWLLGDRFMYRKYIVFNFKYGLVGLAEAK